jgi:acyl-CoA synthetase (NDP forming)
VRLNASFSPLFPPAGAVAMSSQSGALGLAILALARRRSVGVSMFVSVGNKADVSSNDLLQFWEADQRSRVILLYLESFGNPRRFARIARRVGRAKPIIALKAGRTTSGSRAAGSHTAALAASEVAVDALFHQAGVIRAETLDEMFDLAAALESQPLPRGGRVAIVTNAGGPGILCADACEGGGLSVPQLAQATRSALAQFLPAAASLTNPVDMIASAPPEHFRRTIETVLAAEEVDSVIVIFIPIGVATAEDIARAIAEGTAGKRNKPVLACMMAAEETAPIALPESTANGKATDVHGAIAATKIPVYRYPEAAGRALAKIAEYAEWRAEPLGLVPDFSDIESKKARAICAEALDARGASWLTGEEVRGVLAAMRLPLPREAIATTADEAAALARGIGFPVAVKLSSHSIVHKTDFGGVRLNVLDEESVRRAFEDIRARLADAGRIDEMDGILVQPMIQSGIELMMGVTADPLFGPLIAFGLGGIYVEILRDVCFRITPLTDRDAAEMVREIRGYRLLEGYRGHAAADIPAIEQVLLRLSRLVEDVPEIVELDLNPIFALPPGRGCIIADARIRVQE